MVYFTAKFADTISIHAPHEGERHGHIYRHAIAAGISIHAPHEGERPYLRIAFLLPFAISIHAPHEGERQRKSAFVCSISANLLNIIHCGTVTRCIAPQDCIIQAFFGAKKRCFYVRLCFALKNKGVRG